MIIRNSQGYTLVELVVVMAIICLVMIIMLSGNVNPSRTEQFSGLVREFANELRVAQTKSYTVETGDCPYVLPFRCYWRGTVLTYDSSANYTRELLIGADVSFLESNADPRGGLGNKTNPVAISKNGLNMSIKAGGLPRSALALAFLAPNGKAYWCSPVLLLSDCEPSVSNSAPYQKTEPIEFTLTGDGVNLTGIVTFDPVSGTIDSRVE
jgi:prepilin-type N-terminal cleavage/methylation domain-containing protein